MATQTSRAAHIKLVCFCGKALTLPDLDCARGVRCEVCGTGFTVDVYRP